MKAVILLSFLALQLSMQASPKTVAFSDAFEKDEKNWAPSDPSAWAVSEENGNKCYEITKKKSDFKPPHRSPFNISLLEGLTVSDFTLTAKVKTTTKSYGHRDLCVILGYQDPAHFYYVHLGEKTDDHANQIFIVNAADRKKISSKTTEGTAWKEETWHHIKIERNTKEGLIRVYFDDMEKPVMEATDKTFSWGRVGIGSFDDTGKFDDIQIKGVAAESVQPEGKLPDAAEKKSSDEKAQPTQEEAAQPAAAKPESGKAGQ